MTLPSSGSPISLSQIAGEFGGKNPLELGEYRGQDNAPTTGAISFSDFFSTDGVPSTNLQYHYDGQISEHTSGFSDFTQDLTANNYNGSFNGTAAYNSGDFGKVVFDGNSDYVRLTGYNGVTGTTARTSIVFFKLDSSPPSAQQRLLAWGNPATTGGKWAMEINTSGQLHMGVGGGYRRANKTLTTNGWNMVTATWSGGSGGGSTSPILSFALVGTVVSGTGVPNNTTITGISGSTITLSNNLTTTLSDTTLTFTNTYLIAEGGSRGGGGGASGGSGGGSDGVAKTDGGSGGSGGNGASDGGGGGGAGGYTGNGGGENSGGSGGGGAGGANDGDGGGGVGIYGSGTSGSAPRGGGSTSNSTGLDGQNTSGTGGDGGLHGGGGGGVPGNNGSGSGGDGGDGAVRIVWGSLSYPSNAGGPTSSTSVKDFPNGTWTVPAGVTSVSAVVVGGGGGGGDNDPDKDDEGGGGGGGGGLAYGSWSVTAGDVYTVVVGSGGNGGSGDGNDGSSGTDSYIRRAETEAVSGTSGTNTITVGAAPADDIANITLYHNAQKLVDYTDSSTSIDTTTTINVGIGAAIASAASTFAPNGFVDGEIAKVLIYNAALTHAQVAQIYNAKCVALGLSQATVSTEVLVQNDIEYVTGTTSQTTSISLSGIQSGDLLLLFGATDSGNMSTSDPSGWTELTTNNTGSQPDNDNLPDSTAYYRFATGSSQTVTGLSDPNAGAVYVMMAFRNVNSTTPLNTTTQELNSSGSSLSLPSITTTSNGCMIVCVGFLDDDNGSFGTTAPSGYTLGPVADVGGAGGSGSTFATLMTAYNLQTSSGTESPGSFGLGFFISDTYKAYTIALNPE